MAAFQFDRLPPELQLEIINYLGDRKTLYSAIRVKKSWFNYAIGLLWQEPPSKALTTLTVINTQTKRQMYANMVRRLTLWKPESAFNGLRFTSLEHLHFGGRPGQAVEFSFRPFFQPSLRSFSYGFEDTLTTDTLDLIRQHCPNLQSFKIQSCGSVDAAYLVGFLEGCHALKCIGLGYCIPGAIHTLILQRLANHKTLEELSLRGSLAQISSDQFLRFFQNATSLRKLDLDLFPPGSDHVITEEFLAHLADCDTIKDLKLGTWLTHDLVQRCLEKTRVWPLFKNINSLSLQGEARAVAPLISSQSLTALAINLEDPTQGIRAAVGRLMYLTQLDLQYPPAQSISQDDLDALCTLSRLQRLLISITETDDYDDELLQLPWITDDFFKNWIPGFPVLKQLFLNWSLDTPLTAATVHSLAKSCPLLETCSLGWRHDLASWSSLERPLFPKLENLSLGNIEQFSRKSQHSYTEAIKQAEPFAEMIRELIPNFTELYIFEENRWGLALMNTLRPGFRISDEVFSSDAESEMSLLDSENSDDKSEDGLNDEGTDGSVEENEEEDYQTTEEENL